MSFMTNKIEVEDNSVYYLLKRGNPEHIKALRENGQIFIRSISSIRNLDDNEQRTDKYDGIVDRKYNSHSILTIASRPEDLANNGITINVNRSILVHDYEFKGNIYCMTGIFSDDLKKENDLVFDTKSFGEDIIVIYNPKLFIERVMTALEKKGYENVKHDQVQYYEDKYSGPVGNFRKHEKFISQNEFRIFVPNIGCENITINIGSIEDISFIKKEGVLTFTRPNKTFLNIYY